MSEAWEKAARDAAVIWEHGASNRRGVARALVEAIDAAHEATIAGEMAEEDAFAPVRLIGAQLAFLLNIGWDGIGGYVGDIGTRVHDDLIRCKGVSDAR